MKDIEVTLNDHSRTFSKSYSEEDDGDEYQKELLIQLLAKRACHLPGNSYCEDWLQYIYNSHPLFGLCCHNPLHPVNTTERFALLFASIAFGLAVSSGIRLFFYSFVDENYFIIPTNNTEALQLFNNNYTQTILQNTNAENYLIGGFFNVTKSSTSENLVFTISKEDIVSWTVGGALNTVFDIVSWNLSACACLLPGGRLNSTRFSWCNNMASIIIVLISLLITMASVFLTMLRADTESASANSVAQYAFLLPYLIQVFLSWFVYYPIFHTIIFSGVLGCCGACPIFGGRPREVRLMKQNEHERETAKTNEGVENI